MDLLNWNNPNWFTLLIFEIDENSSHHCICQIVIGVPLNDCYFCNEKQILWMSKVGLTDECMYWCIVYLVGGHKIVEVVVDGDN